MGKILIICSKAFYKDIPPIKEKLEESGWKVELPNSYYEPDSEQKSWAMGEKAHSEFKSRMFKKSAERIEEMDAVLTLNFDKNGKKNYIGGSTFLELYEAFMKEKKIYLYNDIPEGMLYDEISGFAPIIINGDLSLVKQEKIVNVGAYIGNSTRNEIEYATKLGKEIIYYEEVN